MKDKTKDIEKDDAWVEETINKLNKLKEDLKK